MKRLDLHVHSYASSDAKGSLMEIAHAAQAAGLHGFVVTDHDACPDMDELQAAADATGLIIVPGCESSTIEGHILCIGVTEAPPKGLDLESLARMVADQGGVCVAAHPLKVFSGIGPTELVVHHKAGHVAAAEGLNGRDRRTVQDNTINLLRRLDIPSTGGTDAHWVKDVGTAWTWFADDVETPEDVVAAIRAGDVRGDGDHLRRRSIWVHRMVYPVRRVGRRIRRGGPTDDRSGSDEEE